ncbi:MAG: N-acetyl-alpha-D-glucosaminyl L-malate synthase BshA [Planctomycetota bacterium]|jgi:N-acetyl-alpha-D-glucosaminyl L-malate synthase BshA
MKIGMVCYPTFGGSGVVATELGQALAVRGHEIHFASYEPPARYGGGSERVFFHQVETPSYPLFRYPPYLLSMASRMADMAEAEALDLFHVHYAIPHTISACVAREIIGRGGMPIVTTLHGTDVTIVGRQREYSRVVEFALGQSDGITAVSRSLAEDTHANFSFEGDIEVVPNFVDPERYRPGIGREFRERIAESSEKVLVHVSNFRPVKNVPDVVRVFARAAKETPARLVLVGDGPEQAACRELAGELGVSDRVRFLGETPDIAHVLACADLFFLPSAHESFGLAALEAMACGVPVIGTNAGGMPEVVEDGQTGMLFEPGDIEGMSGAAVELLADEPRMQSMRDAARGRAVDRFGSEKVVPMYEGFYEKMLASGR